MLQNAYFLAKIGADTAENEQHFAEILPIGRCVGVLVALEDRERVDRPRTSRVPLGQRLPRHFQLFVLVVNLSGMYWRGRITKGGGGKI